MELLSKYYNTKPILLIDEYDTPIQEAYLRGYYEELIPFFRNFLYKPLKDNNLLKKAILTGILRVSKESFFSGLNEEGKIAPYWINTSDNELIRQLLTTSEIETQDKFGKLIAGGTIKEVVDEHIIFQDLKENRAAIWGLFFMSGYLKVLSSEFGGYGNICELAIPNKEVEFCLVLKIIMKFKAIGNQGIVVMIY